MSEDVKTCVTCIFKSGDFCTKQWSTKPGQNINLVTGAVTKTGGAHFYCSTQRRYTIDSCGPTGKWWMPISKQKEKPDAPRQPSKRFRKLVFRVLGVFSD